MNTLRLLLCALCASVVLFAAESPAPRILATPSAPHPKAEVQRVDPAAGVLVFRWLDSAGKPVDSGGSIARFTPVAPLPSEPGQPVTYPDISDATLVAAITTPAAEPAPAPWRVLKDTIILRVKAAGKLAQLSQLIASLPAADQFEFTHSTWFSSNNPQLVGAAGALGLDPSVILARDPLAP
jgi:hypothetical protein